MSKQDMSMPDIAQSAQTAELELYRQQNSDLLANLEEMQLEIFYLNQQLAELEAEHASNEADYINLVNDHDYLRKMFELNPNAMAIIDKHGKLLHTNSAFRKIIEPQAEGINNYFINSFLGKPSRVQFLKNVAKAIEIGKAQGEASFYNGEVMSYNLISTNNNQSPTRLILNLNRFGISSSSGFLYRLSKLAVEQIKEGIMITDNNHKILFVNQSFTEITGYSFDEVIGAKPSILRSGKHGDTFYKNMYDEMVSKGWWSGEIWNKRKNGDIYPEHLQITRTLDELSNNTFYVASFADITGRKVFQKRLDRLAFFDSLTGLPNRSSLESHVENLILRMHGSRQSMFAFIFLDLDKFKAINDTFGHSEGDSVLIQAAQRIVAAIRNDDFAARIGGDEFVIVVTRITSQEDVVKIANKLIKTLNKEFSGPNGVSHHLGTSIGISLYPEDGINLSDLMRRADAAMYKAKEEGRNRFKIFDQELEHAVEEEKKLFNLIKKSISNPHNTLEVHYQPIYNAIEGSLPQAYESLIRIKGEDGETVRPDLFIEQAEDNNLIAELGMVIFELICIDLTETAIPDVTSIEVNLSPMQFLNGTLLTDLKAIAKKHKIDFKRFNFEITETATIENLSIMIDTLHAMRDQGADLLLDDFGTGYASLSMLKDLPTNIIKIDKSFVIDLEESDETQKLIIALISMAKSLNLHIVAEGVETNPQFEWLNANGVDYFQGYLFGKPLPMKELTPNKGRQ